MEHQSRSPGYDRRSPTESLQLTGAPYQPPNLIDDLPPSRFWRVVRWRTLPTTFFFLLGLAGVCSGIWFTCYFWYLAFAHDAPLIYPDNYRALVRWPALIVISSTCIIGAIQLWRGRFVVGPLVSIGSYFSAMGLFYAIDNLW
jgi:hypothetical protein